MGFYSHFIFAKYRKMVQIDGRNVWIRVCMVQQTVEKHKHNTTYKTENLNKIMDLGTKIIIQKKK